MLSSLCLAMAANPSVSRIWVPSGALEHRRSRADKNRRRFTLGFRAGSWQHRILDCGTLILYERCAGGTLPTRRRNCRQAPGSNWRGWQGSAGRSRQWQAPAR